YTGLSNWTPSRRFTTTVILPPAVPALTSPTDNGSSQPTAPTLRWFGVSGATSYSVQLSTDSLFSSSFVVNDSTVADTQRAVTGLAQHQLYFWRARARNAGGVSAWSAAFRFNT